MTNQAEVVSAWAAAQKLLTTIPSHETLADFCRLVEGFRAHRPQARAPVAEHVKALDALVWEKNFQGRVPQVCLDLFARQYALEMVNVLTRVDQRLNEEKQKISALDFDDLELRTLALLERPEVIARTSERYRFFLVDEFQDTNRGAARVARTPCARERPPACEPFHRRRSQAVDLRFSRRRRRRVSRDDVDACSRPAVKKNRCS